MDRIEIVLRLVEAKIAASGDYRNSDEFVDECSEVADLLIADDIGAANLQAKWMVMKAARINKICEEINNGKN